LVPIVNEGTGSKEKKYTKHKTAFSNKSREKGEDYPKKKRRPKPPAREEARYMCTKQLLAYIIGVDE